jgi:uncharacterized protein
MKILIDINHPGHVHFFRNFMLEAKSLGHEVFITASNKDVAINLLNEFNIPFYQLPSYGKSLMQKAIDIVRIDLCLWKYARKIKPDLMMGIASFRVTHIAKLVGAKSYIFDDTEHSIFEIALYKPFATKIFSPSCFFKDLGPKHQKYKGYHELAYLHPSRFKPDISVIKNMGITENETYFIVRFVSWGAGHDIGQKGLSNYGKKKLVELLAKKGKVFITSEYPLESYFEPYRITVSPDKIHHLLYYASMFVGEGGTMASEAAVMGTPSVYINSLQLGYLEELENKYGLLKNFSTETEAISCVEKILRNLTETTNFCKVNQQKMLTEKIDVSSFMVSLIR